jgi:hypothetical protein
MASKPPIKNGRTTGTPVTPSSRGVVHRGRLEPNGGPKTPSRSVPAAARTKDGAGSKGKAKTPVTKGRSR